MDQMTDSTSNIELAKTFLAVHNIDIVELAKELGYVAVPVPPRAPTIEKFEDVFRDPKTGKVCRYGGPWRKWVTKRLMSGYAFEDLVVDKTKVDLLLGLFHQAPKK